jgi:hypothetical protein
MYVEIFIITSLHPSSLDTRCLFHITGQITLTFGRLITYLSLNTMTSFTSAEIRESIDNLDDKIRAAIEKKNVETVFRQERANLVCFSIFFNVLS